MTPWFPRAGAATGTEAPVEAAAAGAPHVRHVRVLVADDNAMVRAVVAGHLEDRGYRDTIGEFGVAYPFSAPTILRDPHLPGIRGAAAAPGWAL